MQQNQRYLLFHAISGWWAEQISKAGQADEESLKQEKLVKVAWKLNNGYLGLRFRLGLMPRYLGLRLGLIPGNPGLRLGLILENLGLRLGLGLIQSLGTWV